MKSHRPFLAVMAALLLPSVLLFSGCKKEEQTGGPFKISGKVYQDCGGAAFAHRELELVHYTNTAMFAPEFIRTVTDASGNFTFTYSSAPDNTSFTDEYQIIVSSGPERGRLLMSRIPGKQDITVGDLFVNNKISVFVAIRVDTAYTSIEDTLYFGLSATDYYKVYPVADMTGVFEFNANVRLYTSMSRFHINGFSYAIGYEAYSKSFQTAGAAKSEILSNADCSTRQIVDTVRIVLH